MKYRIRVIASLASGILAFPGTALATCTSSLVSTPNGAGSSSLNGVGGSSATDVWAVGTSGPYNNKCAFQPLAEHFTGSSWSIVPVPCLRGSTGDFLNAVTAVSPSDAWAVGVWEGSQPNELVEHWTGSAWTVVPMGDATDSLMAVSSVPLDATSVWAVGVARPEYCRQPPGCDTEIAKYWSVSQHTWVSTNAVLYTVNGSLSAVASVPGGNAWAVGSQDRVSIGLKRALIEHWAGGKWAVVPGAVPGGSLSAVAALSDADVWVVGSTNPYGYPRAPLVEHWNGTQWTVVKSPFPFYAFLSSVSELSPSDVWIGGGYRPMLSTNVIIPMLAHYDGTTLSIVPTPGNGLQSSIAGLYQSTAGAWSVGGALPAVQYNGITLAALSHC